MRKHFAIAMMTATTLSACLAATAVQAEVVGKMTAERATITKQGAGRIRSGAPISQGDDLSANSSGSGMILFDDESSARLGPNARLVIDDFVYNPNRRSGTIKLRQTNGSARIFGGQISKRGRSEVRTPHIVLGVRGGIIDVDVKVDFTVQVPDGQTISTLRAGLMVCRVGNQKRTVTNPGISCVSDGKSLSIVKLDGTGRQFVDPSTGAGTSGSNGGQTACNSNAGIISGRCGSRDTGLPGANNPGTRTGTLGTPPGSVGTAQMDPIIDPVPDPRPYTPPIKGEPVVTPARSVGVDPTVNPNRQ